MQQIHTHARIDTHTHTRTDTHTRKHTHTTHTHTHVITHVHYMYHASQIAQQPQHISVIFTTCHSIVMSISYLLSHNSSLTGWLRLVGSWKQQVSFAKEPYKRDYVLPTTHVYHIYLVRVSYLLCSGQNIVSFIGPFCKRDLLFSHVYHV